MQFKVPQFIDIEDKVFGPLTFKQFAYLIGGAGFSYLSIKLLPGIVALVLVPAFIALSLSLAFITYNEKPFIFTLQAFIRYYTHARLYLWHKDYNHPTKPSTPAPIPQGREALTESKLQTLSWSLDVIDPKNTRN